MGALASFAKVGRWKLLGKYLPALQERAQRVLTMYSADLGDTTFDWEAYKALGCTNIEGVGVELWRNTTFYRPEGL